jgi:hypothetical protein
VSAAVGSVGGLQATPEPEPADPPLLIFTNGVPEMEMPLGPISMKLAPALRVSCTPASMITFIPDLM